MKIVKLSNLSNKEREEYERQKIEREERYISSQKKSVPNVITGPTANNNILPKANNWKLATPKETKGAVELTDLATKDYKDNFTQYILDKARLGVQSFGSGIVNLYTTDIQKNNDNALKLSNLVNDKEYNQKIKEKIEEQNKNMIDLSNKISTNDEHSMSIAEQDLPEWQKTTGTVTGVFANKLPSIGLDLLAPGTGLLAMGLSAAGNSMNEEINRGTDPKKAQLTGILKGGIEVATEKITGGNIIAKKGSLDNIVGKTIANKVKSKVAQKVLSKGYEIGGEILEEQISDNAGYVIDKLVNNREMPGFEEWYNNAGETTKITFLSTVLMNALGLGGNTHNNVQQNAETQKWINEAEKITQKENSVQNTAQNTAQIANKPIQRQITQPQIKMPQNGNMRQLNILSVANEQNKYTNRIFNESAKKYNIDITDQSMQTINRVLSERNIQGQFNADLFKDDSQSALWKTSKDANGNTIREVIFNPKASTEKRIQNLSIHELWHDMEGTEISNKLRKLVLDYDSTRSGYEEARQALTETYSQVYDPNSANFNSLVENEAVADILGQKLGDQEFVSNLTRQDRTVGKRLYDWVVEKLNKLNKLVGYKSERIFWTDVKNKFENAFKQEYKGNNNIKTKFSINSYFKQDYDNWKKTDRQGNFLIGKTSEALRSIGLQDYDIVMDKSKILKILNDHPEMNDNIIKTIPDILENPTLILNSESIQGRKVVFGEITDTSGSPVLIALELNPIENKNNIDKIYKVASAYGKQNLNKIQDWINTPENILYIDKQKNRTINWLNGLGLQLPVPNNSSSSITSIPSPNEDVNTTKYSMQESENNADFFNLQKIEEAKEIFGTTKSFLEGGYLTPDGKLLDFSGKRDGGPSNVRYMDHSDIEEIDLDMGEFMDMGNIRMQPESNGIHLSGIPTQEQIKVLKKYFDTAEGNVIVDLSTKGKAMGAVEASKEYKIGTSPDKILHDIESFYKIGSLPVRSSLEDFRYSKNSKKWQKHLNNNYKNEGSGKTIQELKLPTANNIDSYTKKKKTPLARAEKLQNNSNTINNYISAKNETIRNIEQSIKQKKESLNLMVNKDSKLANQLKRQIIQLEERRNDIRTEYNNKIGRAFLKGNKILSQVTDRGIETREQVQERLIDETELRTYNFNDVKVMSKLKMNLQTPTRLVEKIFNKDTANKLKENFIEPIKHNEAEKIRRLNKERGEIEKLGIKPSSKESSAIQMYGEGEYVTEDNEIIKYTLDDLKNNFPDSWQNIKKASEAIRSKYDTYIDELNVVLNENGYDSIPKRKNYFRHFEAINDIFSQIGIPTNVNELPTDINGITDGFKPGKQFFVNALSREGIKTDYDAIRGIDGYLDNCMDMLYHTKDVQKLRTLEKYIRNEYGKEHGFDDFDKLSEAEKQKRIEQINSSHLSEFASWLQEYTNVLAGKKSKVDRSIEDLLGRKVYKYLGLIKKQVGSNMTGFNINSALSNFISGTQGLAKTNKKAFIKGTFDTIKNIFDNDGFVDKSDFLTTRFGSDKIYKTTWNKISSAGQIFMSGTDYFTANQIVRSKYHEYVNAGFSEVEAIKKADAFADKLMAGRGKGDLPNVFNSQMLGILTQFQLEVNNQMDSIFYDTFHENYAETSKTKLAQNSPSLYNSKMAVFVLGQLFAYAYLFNRKKEELTGNGGAFDPIGTIQKAFNWYTNDKLTTGEKNSKVIEEIMNQLPFTSLISGEGRIPISSAMPDVFSVLTEETDIGKEIKKLMFLLPPTGGGQIKKTIEGIATTSAGGSYKTNSKGEEELQYAEENPGLKEYAQSALFGKWALPTAQDYLNGKISKMSAKETEAYKKYKLPYNTFIKYTTANLTKKSDKINFINKLELNDQQKWNIYKYDVFSNEIREKDNSSQLLDAEYITNNGVNISEFLKIYNNAQNKKLEIPTKDEYKKMKNNGLSLKTYMNYKEQILDETLKQRKNGDIKMDGNIKDKDKISIVVKSNYSNKEKQGIYEQYILSDTDKKYSIIKNTGINITQYLKYKVQESKEAFSSDKKDDGTVKGKTIVNSAKNKRYEYIMNMPITHTQKLVLWALEYEPSNNSEKKQLINYVETLPNKTKKEQLDILSNFKGVTIYKDGTFDY